MAIKYVVEGATDLSLDASWVGGSLPSAGDTGYLSGGTAIIVTGLTAVALNRFVVTKGFRGQIGTASTVVSMRVDNSTAPKWEIEGGTFHNIAAHTTGGVATLIVNTPGINVNLGGSGTYTTVVCKAGAVEIGANCVVTNLVGTGSGITARANGTAFTLIEMAAGRLDTQRSYTTGFFDGPSVTRLIDAVAGTTSHVQGNALLNHQSSGTLGTLNTRGYGTYSPAGADQDQTITTANQYGNGRIITKSGQIAANIGTFNDFSGKGSVTDSSGMIGLDGNI